METDGPRATEIELPEALGGRRLWVGGAMADYGRPIAPDDLRDAWVVDCAGLMPEEHRLSAGRFFPYPFEDRDDEPVDLPAVVALCRELAQHHEVATFCQYGANRSALVAGLVLTELGLPGEEAVRLIERQRRGTLTNPAFRALLLGR